MFLGEPGWGELLLRIVEDLIAAVIGAAGTVMFIARKTFPTKEVVEQRFTKIEERMAQGDQRFTSLDGAIKSIEAAAKRAQDAAEKASEAANEAKSAKIDIAKLEGDIKTFNEALEPIKEFTRTLIKGHLDFGKE